MKRFTTFCKAFALLFYVTCIPTAAQTSRDIFQKAKMGDAESQYNLGVSFYNKSIVSSEDRLEATKWLRKAAFQGHGPALHYLCSYVYADRFLTRDIAPIEEQDYMYWMIRFHELMGWTAYYFLGAAYMEGIPSIKVERNYSKALYYFDDYFMIRPAPENGDDYWFFEDAAIISKLNSLRDQGYSPAVTNQKKAHLVLVPNSINLSNRGHIVSGNREFISIQVKNIGDGDSDFSIVWIENEDDLKNIFIPTVSIPLIRPGETKKVNIPVYALDSSINKEISVSFRISDPRGSETAPVKITLNITAN